MTDADSAGRPWAGRSFGASPSAWAGDDGSAPAGYVAALQAFRAGRGTLAAVLDALRDARLLVPLVAGLAEAADHGGRVADRKAELALPTVEGPDGRRVLPAFSSTAAMAAWDRSARPIPAPARQIALGAAADGTELVIVDPAGEDRFGLRRAAVEALARDLPWSPPWEDEAVLTALAAPATGESAVMAVRVGPGDPAAALDGAEIRVVLVVRPGLHRSEVQAIAARVQDAWGVDPAVRRAVDSLTIGFAVAD